MQQLWEEGRCEERWNNMKEKNTARSVGRFYEWGWFVLLCRHMMLLLACDMIRSGKQSKYPLACMHRYMSAEKAQRESQGEESPDGMLAGAYDCGCKFGKTVRRSPLQPLAIFAMFLPVIGTMHGYAHERLCQLIFLLLYIAGAGLEDGEMCERYFSIMNALAAVTRHMSVFHRRKQLQRLPALDILATKALLAKNMQRVNIRSSNFREWLEEEGEYLKSLTRTPPVETLEMEYYLKLKSLAECKARLEAARLVWVNYRPSERNKTNTLETKHQNEQENEHKLIADIQALEGKLSISSRWKADSEEWNEAKKKVKEADYQKALDKLEGLLVARVFEMSRLNIAGTGYKMRKHLANALKTRSKLIQSAIESYNTAAAALSPPRQSVSWEEVISFTYLSEFDLLRDTRSDVQERKWATPSNRLLMQQFFKLVGAEDEINRLHMEIQRLLTYMRDEEELIDSVAKNLEESDPALSIHIRLHWQERGRFNDAHRQRLHAIRRLPGFDPSNGKHFRCGTAVGKAGRSEWVTEQVIMENEDSGTSGGDIDDDLVQWEDSEAVDETAELIMHISADP
ncbi:hypothetical protein BDP27DRAFT_1425551 [Rhodocollybia butyracea]|uniref:Uncharacterized protein n=1 Tax=Rhodocollybia butyracea TaxID=206335 RepID=A0A9P5U2I5_9AGAR|nr:hypothetical protein BDP27DRAFT_1425551 [Rhodocollybia butyracea]